MKVEKSKLKNSFYTILISLFIALLFRIFFFEAFYMPSTSMSPTLDAGDVLFATKTNILNKDKPLHYGDVVLFKFPDEERTYIKRIVGLPNDLIEVRSGLLYINQIPQTRLKFNPDLDKDEKQCGEETLPNGRFYKLCFEKPLLSVSEKTILKENQYFVLSDQRTLPPNSKKIRNYGIIERKDVIAKAYFIWLSFDPNLLGFKKLKINRFLKIIR